MSLDPETSIAATSDAYVNRSREDVDRKRRVLLNGQPYEVFGYKNDPVTGFHATAYKNIIPPHNVIIACRGTDPAHLLTTIQDVAADATMVRDQINPQKQEADAFTREILSKAQSQGISRDQITVAGHSLGGTLAQIEAFQFGLRGTTFNAYGAVGLGYGVPEGGALITDYVMAGDVVSAANRHFGDVVVLASQEDIQSLQAGRYRDARAGAPAPNPLIAVRPRDHSVVLAVPEPGSHAESVLDPKIMAQYEKNYADNKAAFDRFRGDIHNERVELGQALRDAKDPHSTHMPRLPADVQRQLDEYLTLNVDPSIHRSVEGNGLVLGAEHGLQQGAGYLRAGGRYLRSQEEQIAAAARKVGNLTAAVNPMAPLLGVAVGEGAHLQGKIMQTAGNLAGEQLDGAENGVEESARQVARVAISRVHSPQMQAALVKSVNGLVDRYQAAERVGRIAEKNWVSVKQPAQQGADATKIKDSHGLDSRPHQGNGLHSPGPLPRAKSLADPGYTHKDPRHPENPHHELYKQLKQRVPEASESRLLQFADACHTNGITDRNLGEIVFDRQGGRMIFHPSSAGPLATVNVIEPSPLPALSTQHMQQVDLLQAQMLTRDHAPNIQQPAREQMPAQTL